MLFSQGPDASSGLFLFLINRIYFVTGVLLAAFAIFCTIVYFAVDPSLRFCLAEEMNKPEQLRLSHP
jgi:hypothetical protein